MSGPIDTVYPDGFPNNERPQFLSGSDAFMTLGIDGFLKGDHATTIRHDDPAMTLPANKGKTADGR